MNNYVGSAFQSPVVLSFCPGFRGLERGLERAIGKINVAAYVEIEAFVIANLISQMETGFLDPVPVWTDIKTFYAEQFFGKIHGIIGGYPCQPFSHAGERQGENDPRHLWPYIEDAIWLTRPDWCFFENVSGHLSLGYREVRHSLERMDYNVKEGIYSAQEVGAPHRRERLFILAVDNTCIDRLKQEYEISAGRNSAIAKSEKLANTNNKSIDKSGQRFRAKSDTTNEVLDNTITTGLQRQSGNDSRAFGRQKQNGSTTAAGFPMGQGYEQYDWEQPRTTEPGMGCTIDGYNFREDLLRAYGNSVVEQTAELAFIDLLRKHF